MDVLRGPAADLIVAFANRVGALADEMTFCGGNAAQLLVTDPAAVRLRATDDLDVIVAVTSRTAYDHLRTRLSERGIAVDDRADAPLCRFRTLDGIAVDVMPTDGRIVDLETTWFSDAVSTAHRVVLEASDGARAAVSLVSAPALLALKWSAYADRGNHDPLMSHDFEDILTVVAGRPTIVDEIRDAPTAMHAYIADQFRRILMHPDLEAAMEDAIPDLRMIRGLRSALQDRLLAIASN